MAAGVGKKSTICLHSTGLLRRFFCAVLIRGRGVHFWPIAISGAGLQAVFGCLCVRLVVSKSMNWLQTDYAETRINKGCSNVVSVVTHIHIYVCASHQFPVCDLFNFSYLISTKLATTPTTNYKSAETRMDKRSRCSHRGINELTTSSNYATTFRFSARQTIIQPESWETAFAPVLNGPDAICNRTTWLCSPWATLVLCLIQARANLWLLLALKLKGTGYQAGRRPGSCPGRRPGPVQAVGRWAFSLASSL